MLILNLALDLALILGRLCLILGRLRLILGGGLTLILILPLILILILRPSLRGRLQHESKDC